MCLGRINDKSDFVGLVSDSGVLRKLPSLRGKDAEAFEKLSDDFLEILIVNHSTYFGTMDYNIIELRNYILYGTALPKISYLPDAHLIPNFRTQLRYCPKCFIQQIKNQGVSWFKLNWQFSVTCNIHKQKLYHVNNIFTNCCKRSTNIYNSYISAISGKCYFCSEKEWKHASELIIGKRNESQYLVLENDNHNINN